MFALNRISASFQPEGSGKVVDLGEIHDVRLSQHTTIGGETFTSTVELGNPASMEAATNRMARLAMDPSPANIKIMNAEAKRARRNAKRDAAATKVSA